MTIAQRLHIRCFAEGVEIPVISAFVQSQPNQPAVASIQIPANDFALQLKPRTLIHLFFYDFYRGAPASDRAWVAGENVSIENRDRDPELEGLIPPERLEVTDEQEALDLENENYRLLFAGELVGFSMDKTPSSRGVVLQAMDFSMYWDYAFQYQINGFELGGGGIRAAFTGAATNVFNSFLEGNADIITGLMDTPPRSYPHLRGTLLGAVVHLIEAIGGVTYGTRSIRGVNDFFSIAELRLKITQMVGANPFEQQSETRLLHARGFGSLFRRALSGLGKQVSIRDVLNALQRYIFHEVIPITSPHFIPALVDPNRPQFETGPITSESSYTEIIRTARLVKQRALDMKQRQESSTTSEEARELSQRHGGLANELRNLARTCGRAGGLARRLATRERSSFVGGLVIHTKFTNAQQRFGRMNENSTRRAQRTDVRSNTFFPAHTPEAAEVVLLCTLIAEDMEAVCNAEIRRRVQSSTQQPDPPPRLLQQIYRPDVWMVAPPRCNVFFPELYSNFSYSRQYMEEVSRLMLRTSSAFFGSDVLFDGFYMAPNKLSGARSGGPIGRGRTGLEPPDLADAPAWFIRDMMDHELYTGIIPKFERMSDLNLHALRGGSILIDGVRVGYAQLAANHIFFQYRFRSRQLQLSGKFNPFCVLGFPALVVDKYKSRDLINTSNVEVDLDIARRIAQQSREGEGVGVGSNLPEDERQRQLELEETRIDEIVQQLTAQQPNSHYLGTPAAITHSVSAESGGTTQVQMGYARVTDERTEFLGDDRYQPSAYRRTRNIQTRTVVAMSEAPENGKVGPRGGRILSSEDVTDEYQRDQRARPVRGRRATGATGQQRYTSRSRLPLFIPGPRTGRTRGTRVIVGVEVPVSSVPEIAARTGSIGGTQSSFVSSSGTGNDGDEATLTEALITFRAYRITEELGVYRRQIIDLPAEDLTFPPWYGEHYRSQNIGALYGYFFGTGSIVDPTLILDPTGRSAGMTQEEVDGILSTTASTGGETRPYVTTPESEPELLDTQLTETVGAPGNREDTTRVGEIGGSIEEAVTSLVDSYSAIKRNRFDVDDFLRSYTWRRVASMVDIFGTSNLEIGDTGEVVRGVEGFHSRAFGDFDDLRQLVREVDGERRPATILGLTTMDEDDATDPASQQRAARDGQRSARMDTRKEKRLAVLRYVHATLATRGILG